MTALPTSSARAGRATPQAPTGLGHSATIANAKLRVLDLFSGIGGFSLGLERTGGFETVAFCEIEPFPRKVLAKHWPGVPCYEDVRTLTAERLAADGIAVDVICGGFPCQDISVAGKGAGLAGERSGLWSEIARLVRELGPRFLIVENVSALLGRGLGDVLGDLAELGYDAEWHCIPASAVGAPHRRNRVWIVAYPGHSAGARSETDKRRNARRNTLQQKNWLQGPDEVVERGKTVADAGCEGVHERRFAYDAEREGIEPGRVERDGISEGPERERTPVAHSSFGRHWLSARQISAGRDGTFNGDWWDFEPDVGRVAHGVPARVDRLKGLGNAVVPQIPELIGRAILASLETERLAA